MADVSTVDAAKSHLHANTLKAARTLTAHLDEGLPKDRIAAAKEVLDRAGVKDKHDQSEMSMPASMLASAFAGLAMMIGKAVDVKALTKQIEEQSVPAYAEVINPIISNRTDNGYQPAAIIGGTELGELRERLRGE